MKKTGGGHRHIRSFIKEFHLKDFVYRFCVRICVPLLCHDLCPILCTDLCTDVYFFVYRFCVRIFVYGILCTEFVYGICVKIMHKAAKIWGSCLPRRGVSAYRLPRPKGIDRCKSAGWKSSRACPVCEILMLVVFTQGATSQGQRRPDFEVVLKRPAPLLREHKGAITARDTKVGIRA